MKTYDELERAAYLAGNATLAASFAAMGDLENVLNDADLVLDRSIGTQMDEKQEKAIERNAPNAEQYRQFFFDCFEQLGAHYPCPEITSDYDKSVIFDAIENGGAA
jgi:hypothetical protein